MVIAPNPTWPLDVADLEPALHLVVGLAEAEIGILLLHDHAAGFLIPVACSGVDDGDMRRIGMLPAAERPFSLAFGQRHRLKLDVGDDGCEALRPLLTSLHSQTVELLPLFDRDHAPLGAFCTCFRDGRSSTERAMILQEYCAELVACALDQARARAAAERERRKMIDARQVKTQYLARMSHELRTPLQAITGYVDLLRMTSSPALSDAQARMLSRISDSEHLLIRVIDDLITFSRLELGNITYHIADFPANDALRVAEAVVEPLARGHGVRLEVAWCADDLLVRADADKLQQILVNLAANAIKFTPRGGSVVLRCRHDRESAYFDVSDTGPGIAPEHLRDVFEPYVQLSDAVRGADGWGLGLAISREFATAMHGELLLESELGHGSTFTVRLPLPIRAEPVEHP